MTKQQRQSTVSNSAPSTPTPTQPKIANSPTVTSTGSMYWNVRDIVFGPNRSADVAPKNVRSK
jgi:hypothetical protein